jgi:hypothetical protein
MALTRGQSFLDSEEGKNIRRVLHSMTLDNSYNTVSNYSSNRIKYPDNLIPFIDKHINYLNAHPNLEADQYLANIKLMSLIRT